MKTASHNFVRTLIGVAILGAQIGATEAAPVTWATVVNNGDVMPGSTKVFNSYNQPAVNVNGLVVFRARSQGGEGGSEGGESGAIAPTAEEDEGGNQPIHGIYTRNMASLANPAVKLVARGDQVSAPNNTESTFEEFPSTPRISLGSTLIGTRGQTRPVWEYTLDDGSDTQVGTSGVFAGFNGGLGTAVNQLGVVPGFEYYQVPDAPAGAKFDQFPGSPSPNARTMVVFKGNYTDNGVSKTGVYYRDFITSRGKAAVVKLANSNTLIPNQTAGGTVKFGSTAPPSAANGYAVFAGFDNEDAPTLGGIYRVKLSTTPGLQTLAGIGMQVPGEATGTTFNKFGEALSFDGRYVAYWGAWGVDTHEITLKCPQDGNKDVIAYCLLNEDNKKVDVPDNQGIFVFDTVTGTNKMVARTTKDDYDTFVYWNFSGKPPCDPLVEDDCQGDTGSDFEPPRWRSTSFVAVSGDDSFKVAFKATKKTDGVQGIYLADGPTPSLDDHLVLMDTETLGALVDPEAPVGSVVSAVGIERDGFRRGKLVLTSSMLAPDPEDPTKTIGWAGVYLTSLR
ncbi:MAG: hypothetical protein ACXW1W_09230 [Methylococcaceae bacterium]